jgi:Domain of unknown function (DUF6249)
MIMKTTLLTCISSLALAVSVFGQDPTISPAATASVAPIAAAAPPTATASPSKKDDDLESRIERKVKKGLHISIGDDDQDRDRDPGRKHGRSHSDDDNEDLGTLMAIPIVGIIFSTIFGTPVLIVAAIMFFSYLRSRSLHRTVRSMVDKGQEVPAALFLGPPPVVRARSDMRRGVVLVMVGIGLMVFFGAVNDWEGGAWAMGIIPFLIGAGYLLVWKLEGNKPAAMNTSTDNPPRVP